MTNKLLYQTSNYWLNPKGRKNYIYIILTSTIPNWGCSIVEERDRDQPEIDMATLENERRILKERGATFLALTPETYFAKYFKKQKFAIFLITY